MPEQSDNAEVPLPLKVEWICSSIDSASIVCVLSILLRLLVAMAATTSEIMLKERTIKMALATSVSTIVTPACENRLFSSDSRRRDLSVNPIFGGLYDRASGV